MLHEIAPVRSDVGDGGARAALLGLEAPREIGRLDEPVLEVAAVDEMHRPDVAGGDHLARLLDERVAAVVERDGVHDAGLLGRAPQVARVVGGHRERLVGDDVLAPRERSLDHRNVEEVRRRVVNDVDVGVGNQLFVAAVRLRDAERVGFRSRRFLRARGDRNDVDEPEASHGVDVVDADEAGADEAHSDAFHFLLSRGAPHFPIAAGPTPAAVARRVRASQRLKAVTR